MEALEIAALRRAYTGRTVLVTGDTGFKGSWLCLALRELGAEVHGLALPPKTPEDAFERCHLRDIVRHRDGDVRDAAVVSAAVRDSGAEVVFHLAAQALVRPSYEDPAQTFQTNVLGSLNLLEAVRTTPAVRALVFVTSDKCYRNKEWIWGYRENDELGGDDPYSASKAAAELVFASYSASFLKARESLGAASVRAGNVIGGGDWNADRIVPDCVRALRAGRPIVLRNPRSTRPWQHVLEPVFGYLLLGARLLDDPRGHAGAWNFGPRAEATRTVEDLARELVRCWGAGNIEVGPPAAGKHEAGLLQLNCDKARQVLGWQAVWDFAASVRHTADWYGRASGANGGAASDGDAGDMLSFSRRQIQQYLEDARQVGR